MLVPGLARRLERPDDAMPAAQLLADRVNLVVVTHLDGVDAPKGAELDSWKKR